MIHRLLSKYLNKLAIVKTYPTITEISSHHAATTHNGNIKNVLNKFNIIKAVRTFNSLERHTKSHVYK